MSKRHLQTDFPRLAFFKIKEGEGKGDFWLGYSNGRKKKQKQKNTSQNKKNKKNNWNKQTIMHSEILTASA